MPRFAACTLLIGKGHADLWCVIDVHHFQREVLRSATASAVIRRHADGEVAHVVIVWGTAENTFLCVKMQPFGQGFAVSKGSGVGECVAVRVTEGVGGQGELPAGFFVGFLGGDCRRYLRCDVGRRGDVEVKRLFRLRTCFVSRGYGDAIGTRLFAAWRCTAELPRCGIKSKP